MGKVAAKIVLVVLPWIAQAQQLQSGDRFIGGWTMLAPRAFGPHASVVRDRILLTGVEWDHVRRSDGTVSLIEAATFLPVVLLKAPFIGARLNTPDVGGAPGWPLRTIDSLSVATGGSIGFRLSAETNLGVRMFAAVSGGALLFTQRRPSDDGSRLNYLASGVGGVDVRVGSDYFASFGVGHVGLWAAFGPESRGIDGTSYFVSLTRRRNAEAPTLAARAPTPAATSTGTTFSLLAEEGAWTSPQAAPNSGGAGQLALRWGWVLGRRAPITVTHTFDVIPVAIIADGLRFGNSYENPNRPEAGRIPTYAPPPIRSYDTPYPSTYGAGVSTGLQLSHDVSRVSMRVGGSGGWMYFERPVPNPDASAFNFLLNLDAGLDTRVVGDYWIGVSQSVRHLFSAGGGISDPGITASAIALIVTRRS